jgi:hypothetical protein
MQCVSALSFGTSSILRPTNLGDGRAVCRGSGADQVPANLSQHCKMGALNRGSESTALLFAERFGTLDIAIRDFTERVSGSVTLIDISALIPSIRTVLQD